MNILIRWRLKNKSNNNNNNNNNNHQILVMMLTLVSKKFQVPSLTMS